MGYGRAGVRKPPRLAGLFCWALAVLPATAVGQGAGVLAGTVVDASNQAPLEKVTVTASSPGIQGEQIVVTDSSGSYRVPQLPPGVYAVRFNREGFKPFVREGIELPPGYTLRFNAQLVPETIAGGAIVALGRAPLIDVGSAQQGGLVDQDFIRTIPVARPGTIGANGRSFETLALTVPTARQDLYGVSIDGTTSPENSYLIDGLSTRNPGFGISGSRLSMEFVDSVTVDTGAYQPEYGRTTGGIISAQTKSGGDEFHGSVWGTWTPGTLAGAPHPVGNLNNAITYRTELHNVVDFGATLGGYIVKDRLWFFVGFQPEFSRYRVNRDVTPFRLNDDGTQYKDPHGRVTVDPRIYTSSNFADEHQIQYFGKLTYLFNQDHRLALSVAGTPAKSGGANAYAFSAVQPGVPISFGTSPGSPGTVFRQNFDGNFDLVLKLSSSFAQKRVLLDVTAGWHHEDHNVGAADGSKIGSTDPDALANQPFVRWAGNRSLTEFEDLPPAVVTDCLSDGHGGTNRCRVSYTTGGPGRIENQRYDSLQAKAVVTFLFEGLGHHVLKVGLDADVATYEHVLARPGGTNLVEAGDHASFVDRPLRYGYLTGPDQEVVLPFIESKSKGVLLGGFVQDSWDILDRITLNVGVRYDAQSLYAHDGQRALTFPDEWSPRIGLIWDFTQAGRSKIYANYARYYENVPLDVADRAFGSAPAVLGKFAETGGACNPRNRSTSACQSRDNLVGGYAPSPNPHWFAEGNVPAAVDPKLKPPSEDEWVAGIEYEVLPNTRVSLAYTHRNIVRWVEDMKDVGNAYFIGNPGEGAGASFTAASRVYDSVTVAVSKTFSDLWLARVSYSWQNLVGNIEGLFRTQNSQLDPNINTDFDLARLLVNRYGPLPGDVRHTIKAYVSKEFVVTPVLSITTGLAYVGSSGTPIEFLGADSFYGAGEVYVFPRGSGGRLAWQHTVDVNGGLSFRISPSAVLTFSVNIFNLFNFQQVTRVSQDYTTFVGVAPVPNGNPSTDRMKIVTQTGEPLKESDVNPNFWRPALYQPVRQFRFQARLTF